MQLLKEALDMKLYQNKIVLGFYFILLSITFIGCAKPVFKTKWLKEESPSIFITRFETTKGVFDVEINREWSPLAADRFYQTVKHRFYNNTLFYRVVPKFVVQWGNNDTAVFKKWSPYKSVSYTHLDVYKRQASKCQAERHPSMIDLK